MAEVAPDKVALFAAGAPAITYSRLVTNSTRVAETFVASAALPKGARIVFLCAPGADYVVSQLAAWRAGCIAVPLCITHPLPELEYVTTDSGAVLVVADAKNAEIGLQLALRARLPFVNVSEVTETGEWDSDKLPDVDLGDGASILYTSGTTARPKGVLCTHRAVAAQTESLVNAWRWTSADRIPHFLPLHHTHGVVNKLACPLWVGAQVDFVSPSAATLWNLLTTSRDFTVFMAVPTIYVNMIEYYNKTGDEAKKKAMRDGAAALRLMVSGSAALPISVLNRWREITGHTLLERYGMTEGGMFLSNSLEEDKRRPGCVGLPLEGVTVKLVSSSSGEVVKPPSEEPGELRFKGPNLFTEYWGRKEATAEVFDEEGFFRTGDIGAWSVADGCYRILGRDSVDIIKTGGHKVSALEVERVLLEHPGVAEAVVVGVPDVKWGQSVGALIRIKAGVDKQAAEAEIRALCNDPEVFPVEKRPRQVIFVDEIPKNAMGKVAKKTLLPLFETKTL